MPSMDYAAVTAWLAAYVAAWKSYEADAIGYLFSEDARYRYHPWDEPVQGRAAIVASWLEDNRDQPGTFDGDYTPIVVEGNRAVATGRSRYFAADDHTTLIREYRNVFVLTFNDAGECSEFTEWYMQTPPEMLGL